MRWNGRLARTGDFWNVGKAMTEPRIHVNLSAETLARALREDVRAGLTADQKWLPPKWLYDARGSELFDQITALPEYYPTRAERAILAAHAADIARRTRAATLIELGSGSSEKTRLLLEPLVNGGTLHEFMPLDVSETALRAAAAAIAVDYPMLRVVGVVDDFTEGFIAPLTARPRLVAFLGSTIGNLVPGERAKFLAAVRGALDPGDWLLLGTDLVKSEAELIPAYDDAAGVTAEFNRNVLRVLNRELGANFPVDAFVHRALWDPVNEWIEMRLRANRPVHVTIPGVGLDVRFAEGEELHTEISAKFRRDGIAAELEAAGFVVRDWFTDPANRFALSLAAAR